MFNNRSFISLSLSVIVLALVLAYVMAIIKKNKSSADFVFPPDESTSVNVDELLQNYDISNLNSQLSQ